MTLIGESVVFGRDIAILCSFKNAPRPARSTSLMLILKNRIEISTLLRTVAQGNFSSLLANSLAISLSFPTECLIFRIAIKPGPAITPACLMPPPSNFLFFLNISINSLLPATTLPTGAHSPLLKHTIIESAYLQTSDGSTASSTHALNSRAPSRWTLRPFDRASPQIQAKSFKLQIRPRAVGNSTSRRVVQGLKWLLLSVRMAAATSLYLRRPPSVFMVFVRTRAIRPRLPFSYWIIWHQSARMISSPCRQWVSIEH